jgi:hypothetical protein
MRARQRNRERSEGITVFNILSHRCQQMQASQWCNISKCVTTSSTVYYDIDVKMTKSDVLVIATLSNRLTSSGVIKAEARYNALLAITQNTTAS